MEVPGAVYTGLDIELPAIEGKLFEEGVVRVPCCVDYAFYWRQGGAAFCDCLGYLRRVGDVTFFDGNGEVGVGVVEVGDECGYAALVWSASREEDNVFGALES